MEKGVHNKKIILVIAGACIAVLLAGIVAYSVLSPSNEGEATADTNTSDSSWAFEATFDGLNPESPSQELLPEDFGYVATHRTHPTDVRGTSKYQARYSEDCADITGTHTVSTSNANMIDEAFFICNERLMSSMGDVAGYSIATFWPKQEFNFSDGGVLEFDTDLLSGYKSHAREIVIVPRGQENYFTAVEWAPITETYPPNSIVLSFSEQKRHLRVHSREDGQLYNDGDWKVWGREYPDDPAFEDPGILRTMRIIFKDRSIDWCIINPGGDCDTYTFELDTDLPFSKGLVLFNTLASEPEKSGNTEHYTYQWDNIRFSGSEEPVIRSIVAPELVYMEDNGNRALGDSAAVTMQIDKVGSHPALVGQVHNGKFGQVVVKVNGSDPIEVTPHGPYPPDDDCAFKGWRTFFVPIDQSLLSEGENTLEWIIGEPECEESSVWDGYSIKSLQIQFSESAPDDNQRLTYEPLTTGNGLRGYYYNDINPGGNQYLRAVDEKIDFNWEYRAPRPGIQADPFSVRWEGFIVPEFSEEYTFHITSDDGVRLTIGEEEVIDFWKNTDARESAGTVNLEAGERYKIVLEYFDQGQVAEVQLSWSSKSLQKEIVPKERLYTR